MELTGTVIDAFFVVTDQQHLIKVGTKIKLRLTDPFVGGWTAYTDDHTFGLSGDRVRRMIQVDR